MTLKAPNRTNNKVINMHNYASKKIKSYGSKKTHNYTSKKTHDYAGNYQSTHIVNDNTLSPTTLQLVKFIHEIADCYLVKTTVTINYVRSRDYDWEITVKIGEKEHNVEIGDNEIRYYKIAFMRWMLANYGK